MATRELWCFLFFLFFCFFKKAFPLPALWILEKQNTGTEEEVCPLSPAKCLFIHLMCKLAFSASSAKLKLVTECRPWWSSQALHGSLVTDEWRGAQSLEGQHTPAPFPFMAEFLGTSDPVRPPRLCPGSSYRR